MAKLVLLDGHSLAYRAFFALPPDMATKSGEITNATFGFTTMLLDVLEREKPDYIAVAFDIGRTWRHDRYAEYKGHRGKAPSELHHQVERVKEIVQTFNIPSFMAKGWEADDVLGTLARAAAEQGVEVLVVTGDTDAHQLVTERITVQNSGRRFNDTRLYDPAAIEERYGLDPAQLVDYKAMLGDKSDNIPGVPGVGEKTATGLLKEYGSLEAIYAHLEELKPGVRKRLEEAREDAFLSKELATIETRVPGVELDLEACRTQDFDRHRVFELFRELQFTSLIDRIPQSDSPDEPLVPAQDIPCDYRLVSTEEELAALAEAIGEGEAVTLDVETDGLDAITAKLVGLAVGLGPGTGFYLPIAHRAEMPEGQLTFEMERPGDPRNLSLDRVTELLNPAICRPGLKIYAHNAKFDVEVLLRHGFEVPAVHHDSLIGAWLLNPGSRQIGLKSLALSELGQPMTEITELIGKGRNQITMDLVDVTKVTPYACADVDMTSRLVPLQIEQLKERSLYDLFHDVEMPLLRVLVDMELRGVAFDPEALTGVRQHLTERLAELEAEIYGHAGYEFNINSPLQLSEVLFDKLGLDKRKSSRTKAGYYSTAVNVLESLQKEHEIIAAILEQRTLQKLLSTYVDQLPAMVNPATGRIHTDFSMTAAETGRLSSSNPNLQNIPTRTELGQQVREAFVAPEEHLLLSTDYSQVELRVLAHLSGDDEMIAAFLRGEDIHAATASNIFHVPLDEVSRDQRRIAKCVAADTLVTTSRGLVEIGALGEGMDPGEYRPIDLIVATDGEPQRATHVYHDGTRAVVRITAQGGFSIACTPRHRLRVIDEAGEYVWRFAEEIRVGDAVALREGAAQFGNEWEIPEIRLPDGMGGTNFKDIALPAHWSTELARFLGYLVSEGYVHNVASKKYTGTLTISQSMDEPDVATDMAQVARELFGERAHVVERDGHQYVHINSGKLNFWLAALGVAGRSHEKTVPDALLRAPRSIQVEFLRALFAGDGSLKNEGRTLTYATKSPALARRLQGLLLNLGFVFSLYGERRQGYADPYYVLRLGPTRAVQRFASEIGCIAPRKMAAGRATHVDHSEIPHQQSRLQELRSHLHGDVRERIGFVLRANRPVRLNHTQAARIVAQLEHTRADHPSVDHFKQLLRPGLRYHRVTRIEWDEAPVYDLVVPEGNTYLANGFVSHNTINFGLLYGMSAFRLARETGLEYAEADEVLHNYFKSFPLIERYLEGIVDQAEKSGYAETIMGRRRYFPELLQGRNSNQGRAAERAAKNHPIQGSAAEIIKVAMIDIHRLLREAGFRSRMVLQVHDELLFEVPEEELPEVLPLIIGTMTDAMELKVPLKVDSKVGRNWSEMHALEEFLE